MLRYVRGSPFKYFSSMFSSTFLHRKKLFLLPTQVCFSLKVYSTPSPNFRPFLFFPPQTNFLFSVLLISASYQVGSSQKPFAFIWGRVDSSSLVLEVLTFKKDFWLPGWIFNWHDWRHFNKVKWNSWRWVAVFGYFFSYCTWQKIEKWLKEYLFMCNEKTLFLLLLLPFFF